MTDYPRHGMGSGGSLEEPRDSEWAEPDGGSSLEEIAATLDQVRGESRETCPVDDDVFPVPPYSAPGACRAFAEGLSDQALGRALTVFEQLEVDGRLDAGQLAGTLGLPATGLWGTVSNPIKRQADALGLPMPYDIVPGAAECWVDTANVAPSLVQALRSEMRVRIEPVDASSASDRGRPNRAASGVAEPSESHRSRKYAPLTTRLEQLEKGERRLGLEQIEAVLGFELPPKAWADADWWANDANLPYLRHADAWLSAGWHAFPDLASQAVIFRPASSDGEQPAITRPRRHIGRWTKGLLGRSRHRPDSPQYDPRACREFAAGLSDPILMRAECLFRTLAKRGEIESSELAELLSSETSRLGGQLATPLRRRAHVLALDPPYAIAVSEERGRVWRPASGSEAHLPRALTKELRSR